MIKAGEMIISGFVSKIVSDIVDIPEKPIKDAIRNADKKKRNKNQTIETRIYQVTIDAIKEFTKRDYNKGQDVIYDAAESIIMGFKNSNNNIEAVRVGLKMLVSQVTSEMCVDFLKILQHEICIDENDILYKEICMIQGTQTFEAMCEGFDVSSKNDEETHKKLDYLIEKQNGKEIQGVKYLVKSPIVNRADEYAQRWSKNVFLNNFNKRDKNAGVNIKLQEIYPEKNLPHYKWKSDDEESADLKELLREYIVDNDEKKMLLILGQAGIGKSTLITWIMANLVEKKENILVYQFASDLGNVNWQDNNILDEIFATIELDYNELEGKTLILDGFDEIYVKGDRERILRKMYQELKKKNFLKTFSIIITCRENYLDKLKLKEIEYITLQTWNETQIRGFCETYEEVIISKDSARKNRDLEIKIGKIIEKKDIMGIPLILYMVLALNVNVEKSSSTVDIYDQVFSLKSGGIYDRGYDVEHRINAPEIKKHIHRISQRIAFWMFENNADEATISHEKFEEICENEMKELMQKDEDIKRDTLIGNFFQLKYCEGKGTDELQFVHRSIYEYFVVIYFFESIYKLKSKEEVAGKLGELLKYGMLSKQILEFIKYKFDNNIYGELSDVTREIFNIMLRDGMTYYTKEKYKKIIERELKIFINMLEVVHLWNINLKNPDSNIAHYLRYNSLNKLNLSGANLSGANLSGAYLSEANLSGANLSGAYLKGAYLSEANLSEANLSKVHLEVADLSGANLSRATLNGVILCETDLTKADLEEVDMRELNLSGIRLIGANLRGTVFAEKQLYGLLVNSEMNNSRVQISETNEIISYREYCNRKSSSEEFDNFNLHGLTWPINYLKS